MLPPHASRAARESLVVLVVAPVRRGVLGARSATGGDAGRPDGAPDRSASVSGRAEVLGHEPAGPRRGSGRRRRGGVEMLIEYRLPLTSKRADVVLAGRSSRTGRPAYLVVELKQWSEAHRYQDSDVLVTVPSYGSRPVSHPLDQVHRLLRVPDRLHRNPVRAAPRGRRRRLSAQRQGRRRSRTTRRWIRLPRQALHRTAPR